MPTALYRLLQTCALALATLLALPALAGPAQDFAAADNAGRASLLESWAAAPEAERLPLLEAIQAGRFAVDAQNHAFLLGDDKQYRPA
ncbi:urea ABC transporter permease subunit UrtB, partial [Pseudomonas sp. RW407]